jgi:glutamyl-tRNA reductase
MKLFLNYITHRNCPVEHREKAALSDEQRRQMLRHIRAEKCVREAAIIQTCNRTEFYLYAKKDFDCRALIHTILAQFCPDGLDGWARYSKSATGADAVRHLFEVVAGLDSQMLGENQIISQVKAAYTQSIECRMSKFLFHHLFHTAFRAGKAVRTQTDINCGAVSISLAAVEFAKAKLNLCKTAAIIIGAGENAALAAKYLVKSGLSRLIIANRTSRKAQALAEHLCNAEVIGLGDIPARLTEVDLVVASTGSTKPVLTYDTVKDVLKNRKRPLLFIDIAVPRDVDPQIARFKCARLVNIDDLNEKITANRQKRSKEIPKAGKIVDDYVRKFVSWQKSLEIVPVIKELTGKGLSLARGEANRYAKGFGRENALKLQVFAESLVKKILHGPISFLKSNSADEPTTEQLRAADLVNKMFLSQDKDRQ